MSNKWITDRRPTANDTDSSGMVWTTYDGRVIPCKVYAVTEGRPWMPIYKPEPYTENVCWEIMTPEDQHYVRGPYAVYLYIGGKVADQIPTREAAKRIAQIYMEARP